MTMDAGENIAEYLQGDAPRRVELFPAFLKALADLRRSGGGNEQAAGWARTAVSPDLDYTSVLSLRRFLAVDRGGERLRLAVLGGPTTIQLTRLLEAFLASMEIDCELYEGEYELFRQEILDPRSGLATFRPQVVFIATSARAITLRPGLTLAPDRVGEAVEGELAAWLGLWETAHRNWGCTIIQNTFETAPWGSLGHYAARHPAARERCVALLNSAFAARAPRYVLLHDMDLLARETGTAQWFDPRFHLEAKMPCAPECLVQYAHSVASLVRALRGKSKKALVLDLDDTLWGGVVGDVGIRGIQFGQGSALGEAFLGFQAYLKELRERGILLAVCSKNDPAHAREPFEQRADMVLKLDDFACFVANWEPKPANLREIADRLRLGLDSLVFVDDNPAERALVRRLLPQVAVPDLPEDPAGFIPALGRHRYFETIAYTEEDAQRADYYRQEADRQALSASHNDLDGFLASLDMRGAVEPIGDTNLERASQLLNKTNQFNLTNRRYTPAELGGMAAADGWRALAIRLRDKLGDNGIISVLLLRSSGAAIEIDNWVMSCRVFQRGVERFVFNRILELARREGASEIRASYVPTARNGMVSDHYPALGFEEMGRSGETVRYRYAVERESAGAGTHIQLENAT